MKRHSLPVTAGMISRAERGANRLNCLFERHLDPAELSDSVGAVRVKALCRFSKKFFKTARDMMENLGSRCGEGSKAALAHLISIAVRKEDFSINYDSWLGSIAQLVETLGPKGIDIAGFLRFSFSSVIMECETYSELDVAMRATLEYSERLGPPDSFCKDDLCRMVRLHLPPAELAEFCDVVIVRLLEMPSEAERSEAIRLLSKKLDEDRALASGKMEKMLELIRG